MRSSLHYETVRGNTGKMFFCSYVTYGACLTLLYHMHRSSRDCCSSGVLLSRTCENSRLFANNSTFKRFLQMLVQIWCTLIFHFRNHVRFLHSEGGVVATPSAYIRNQFCSRFIAGGGAEIRNNHMPNGKF